MRAIEFGGLLLFLSGACAAEAPPASPNLAQSPPAVGPPPASEARASPADVAASLQIFSQGVNAAGDYHTRLVATEALGHVPGSAPVVALLEARLGDPEEDVRAAAVLSLGRQAAARRACPLLRSVRDDTEELLGVRVLAARALLENCHVRGRSGN